MAVFSGLELVLLAVFGFAPSMLVGLFFLFMASATPLSHTPRARAPHAQPPAVGLDARPAVRHAAPPAQAPRVPSC